MSGALRAWIDRAAQARRARGHVRTTRVVPGLDGAGGPVLDLASNDYLGLSRDPRVVAAAVAATEWHGAGARASRVVTGTLAVHEELEAELCRLTGRAAALAFSTGYAANLGVLGALGGPGVLVASDAHAHASLIDGARLSRARVAVWPHGDLDALAALLAARTEPRALVVVESVYSVLGDTADLPALAALCAAHDAVLVVDEAHGIGVAGGGRGAVHAAGLADAGHVVVTATLSKALGAQGGAVLGSPALRDHLVNRARSFVFDTGLAPAPAAAAAEACRIVAAEPRRVAALLTVAGRIAAGAGVVRAAGAVQSVPVGEAGRAVRAAAALEAEGVVVGCFRPPSVPDGVSRLRLTARADLDPATVDAAVARVVALLRDDVTGEAGVAGVAG